MSDKYSVENIEGNMFMEEDEKEFFEKYSTAIEQQEETIAEQHGMQIGTDEFDKVLRYMEYVEEEYVVDGAMLGCTKATSERMVFKHRGEEIESIPLRTEENSRMKIKEVRGETINGLIPANIEDRKGGLIEKESGEKVKLNIISFGNCSEIKDGQDIDVLLKEKGLERYEEKIIDAIKAGKGTCYCLMKLDDEWDNLPLAGEYMTGGFPYYCAGIEKALLSGAYMKFNEKEGINMLSMLFCNSCGGIVTAQESGQTRSMKPNEDLYRYMEEQIDNIDRIDEKYAALVNDFRVAYEKNRNRYERLAKDIGVPPELIAIIHYRENTTDYLNGTFNVYLHNGEKLGQVTVKVPKGKLFYDFESAAKDVFSDQQSNVNRYNLTYDSKDMVSILCFAERYNGLGYYNNNHVSPYIFSGTNVYTSGKYVEVLDSSGTYKSQYMPNEIDNQVGAYLLLSSIL